MRQYLSDFFAQFHYPQEAAEELLCAYDQLCSNKAAAAVFERQIAAYEATGQLDREEVLIQACDAANMAGILEDHATFLFFCCFSRHLKKLYADRGISEAIWYNSMTDLRIKVYECKAVKGHWGSFVSGWFTGFFNMTRFALGRLQFETVGFNPNFGSYENHGIRLASDTDIIINVHIPSGSPLPYHQVLDAYRQAYDFYRQNHRDGKLVFGCWSWLMYDRLPEIAGEGTNTYRFIMDYETVMRQEDPDFIDCWRLFDVPYSGDPAALPRNGGLRRRYAEFLEQGGTAGMGYGIAVFDGDRMLSRKQLP